MANLHIPDGYRPGFENAQSPGLEQMAVLERAFHALVEDWRKEALGRRHWVCHALIRRSCTLRTRRSLAWGRRSSLLFFVSCETDQRTGLRRFAPSATKTRHNPRNHLMRQRMPGFHGDKRTSTCAR